MKRWFGAVKLRGQRGGGNIAEIAPVLFVLFLLIFFPLIDLITLTLTYTAGAFLNHDQLREAALTAKSVAENPDGPIQKTLVDQWKATGIGQFASTDKAIKTVVTYKDGVTADEHVVVVTTTVEAKPFMKLPMFDAVPGIGKDMTFEYSDERLMEDPQNFTK